MPLTNEQAQELGLAHSYDVFRKSQAGQDLYRFMAELESQASQAIYAYTGEIKAETLVIRMQQRKAVIDQLKARIESQQELKEELVREMNREEQ